MTASTFALLTICSDQQGDSASELGGFGARERRPLARDLVNLSRKVSGGEMKAAPAWSVAVGEKIREVTRVGACP